MVMYAETMLIPAIPTLIKAFDVGYGLSSWILSAYLVSGAVMTPIAGKLADIYGKKKILLVIMMIYLTGVSAAGFSNNIYFTIILRAIQGVGMSMFPIAFGIIREQFPKEKVSIAQGIITSMFATGSIIGLSLGGIIIQNFGWRMTFFTIIPISIILIVVINKMLNVENKGSWNFNITLDKKSKLTDQNIKTTYANKEGDKQAKISLDIKGSMLLAITIISFLLALTLLQSSPSSGYYSNLDNNDNGLVTNIDFNFSFSFEMVIFFIIMGTVSLALFIINEKSTKFPLIDFKFFLKPSILLSSILIMITGMCMFMVFQTIPILVQTPQPIGFNENPVDTGKVQLPFAIVLLIFGTISGFIISKLGSLKPVIFGSFLTTFGFVLIFLFHGLEVMISLGLAILAAGLSLAAVSAMNIIILSVSREDVGVTIGMSSMLRIVGGSIGPALAAMYMQTNQSIIHIKGTTQSLPSLYSFDLIFLTAVLFSLVSLIISIILSKKVKISLNHL